jgi:hypothetical protein
MNSMRSKGEAEWASCEVPRLMFLDFEDRGNQGLISRELRLFACACCRHIASLMPDQRSSQAVDVAERYADGNASRDELNAAYAAATLAETSTMQRIKQINSAAPASAGDQETEEWRLFRIDDWHPEGRRLNAAQAASHCANVVVMSSQRNPELKYCGDWRVARSVALYAHLAGASRDRLVSMEAAFLAQDPEYLTYEDQWQADILRCVFRNPFRPLAADTLDVQPRIRDMAESIYRLRAFDRMPALGKELNISGCVDPDLVAHCASTPVHARGCWAIDVVRGIKRVC